MPPITASTDVAAALAHSRRRASLPPASDSPARVAQNRRTGGRGGMRRGSGGVPAWTPLSDPDTVLWLDAALSPRTESTGAIDQWNDLSPTGAHASATLTTRPTHDATAIGGSYPGIVFDGVNDFMTCTAGTLGAALSGRSGITIFSVWVDTTVAARYLLEYGANGGTTLAGSFATLLNITNANSSSTYARGNIGSNIWRSNVGTEDFVTPKIFTQSIDFTAAAASEVGAARINGSAIAGAQVGASENTSTFTSQILAIGAQVSGASPIAGKLGVLIIVGRAMTDADKLVFERYLGGRFGLPFSDVMAARAAIQTPRILWLGQSNAMGQLDAYTTIERWDGPHVKPSILAYKDFYSAAWFTSTWGRTHRVAWTAVGRT